MALSGLEQRCTPLEDAYRPYGPTGLPAWAHLLDEEETPATVVAAAWRRLQRSRSFSHATWRDANRLTSQEPAAASVTKPSQEVCCGAEEERGCLDKRPQPLQTLAEDGLQCQAEANVTAIRIAALGKHTSRARLCKKLATMGFEGRFDFVYLPMQFGTNKNNGSAYVNFTSPSAAAEFMAASNKPPSWVLMPAKRQGLAANTSASTLAKMDRVRNRKYRPMIVDVSSP